MKKIAVLSVFFVIILSLGLFIFRPYSVNITAQCTELSFWFPSETASFSTTEQAEIEQVTLLINATDFRKLAFPWREVPDNLLVIVQLIQNEESLIDLYVTKTVTGNRIYASYQGEQIKGIQADALCDYINFIISNRS